MLTLQDCVDLCDLTEDEILAIAEHEHVPEIVAAEMAEFVMHRPDGVPIMRRILLEDIEMARMKGDLEHSEDLTLVLNRFIAKHPEPGQAHA